jgi:hypothetical protein
MFQTVIPWLIWVISGLGNCVISQLSGISILQRVRVTESRQVTETFDLHSPIRAEKVIVARISIDKEGTGYVIDCNLSALTSGDSLAVPHRVGFSRILICTLGDGVYTSIVYFLQNNMM